MGKHSKQTKHTRQGKHPAAKIVALCLVLVVIIAAIVGGYLWYANSQKPDVLLGTWTGVQATENKDGSYTISQYDEGMAATISFYEDGTAIYNLDGNEETFSWTFASSDEQSRSYRMEIGESGDSVLLSVFNLDDSNYVLLVSFTSDDQETQFYTRSISGTPVLDVFTPQDA